MLTYQNITKAEAVASARRHRVQRRLVQRPNGTMYSYYQTGEYWLGSSIGCDVRTNVEPHKMWANLFGTPPEIPALIDRLFKTLPQPDCYDWHVEVREAIPEGVDLKHVGPLHASRCLRRCLPRMGDGTEPWRVECREVATLAAEITGAGEWIDDELAMRADKAFGAAHVAWFARCDQHPKIETEELRKDGWASLASLVVNAAQAEDAEWCAECLGSASVAAVLGTAEVKVQAHDLLELLRDVGEWPMNIERGKPQCDSGNATGRAR